MIDTDIQVHTGENIIFSLGSLTDFEFTGSGYKYIGTNEDIILVSLNIQYKSLSHLPYEIVNFVLKVNGVERCMRRYGFDMQERIKDEFLIDLDPDDILEFVLADLYNSESPAATIEEKSFITLNTLQLHHELNSEL